MIVGFKNKSGCRFKGHKEIAALHFFINQFRIQGAFGAGMPVETTKKWSQKINQYSKQSLLFIKELIDLFFLCVAFIESSASEMLTFGSYIMAKEKTEIAWKTMKQLPKPMYQYGSKVSISI